MAAGYAEGQTWLWTGAGIALLVNVWRYAQARATLERLTSGETPSPAALFAFVNRETLAPGQTQFKRGDTGAEMYLVVDGEIEIVELAKSPWSCPRTGARRQRAPKRKQRARA
jgi:hypothetical protein